MSVEHQLRVYFPLLPVSICNSNSPSMQSWTSLVLLVSTPSPTLLHLFLVSSERQGRAGSGKVIASQCPCTSSSVWTLGL